MPFITQLITSLARTFGIISTLPLVLEPLPFVHIEAKDFRPVVTPDRYYSLRKIVEAGIKAAQILLSAPEIAQPLDELPTKMKDAGELFLKAADIIASNEPIIGSRLAKNWHRSLRYQAEEYVMRNIRPRAEKLFDEWKEKEMEKEVNAEVNRERKRMQKQLDREKNSWLLHQRESFQNGLMSEARQEIEDFKEEWIVEETRKFEEFRLDWISSRKRKRSDDEGNNTIECRSSKSVTA